jgi:hypothetical protein
MDGGYQLGRPSAGLVQLAEFKDRMARCLEEFSRNWARHQRREPNEFPSCLSLEEWWSDFSELVESHVAQTTVDRTGTPRGEDNNAPGGPL